MTEPDGSVIVTCPANKQTTFVAQTNKVLISDDEARITEVFNGASLSAPEGGETTPPLPAEALSWKEIENHFAINAQPGTIDVPAATSAPSAVYISRVPWARWEGDAESGQWVNNASEVNEEVFGVARKLMDNAGLQHQCSTDTVEGVDDYNGKLWPFYWQHANYVTDVYGVKHITAIKGIHADFDPYTKNVGAFGPAFWFFCCLEHSKDEQGNWRTHDGTENGTPLFQLWGISTRPWEELDEGRRAELAALGVTADDVHMCPGCHVWDDARGEMVLRPYWCYSAYCGGAEEQEDGSYMLVSKRNLPIYNDLSHNKLNALYDNKAGYGGSACVQGLGMLFDIVKNATKDSQSIHSGMSYNENSAVPASLSIEQPDYLFPIASQGNFEVGCTVWLWQTAGKASQTTYHRSAAVQIGRIEAIETRSLTLADGTTTDSLCLVIDPTTVEPFVVCTGEDDAAAIAATKELTDQGIYACCFATQGMALSGETDAVIGKHDGSRTSNSSGRHPYRVQGTEFMPGTWIVAADTVALKGDGATAVTVDRVELTPTSCQSVIMQAPCHATRRTDGSLGDFLSSGYIPIGISIGSNGAWIVNVQLSASLIHYPVAGGGSGSSSSTGHADFLWWGANLSECLHGGPLDKISSAGSACLALSAGLSHSNWHIGGRD